MVVDEELQVFFQTLVSTLDGSISFWLVCSGKMLLDVQNLTDYLPEVANKLWILI